MAQGAAIASDIRSASWSLMLDSTAGAGSGSGIGSIVQGLQDLNQCIQIILLTYPGQDPLRPTFGCPIINAIDVPLTLAQSKIVGLVVNALGKWEPRVTVISVQVLMPVSQPGSILVIVNWSLNLAAIGTHANQFGLTGIQQTTVAFV
jgi:phage baseplate assembly protein W